MAAPEPSHVHQLGDQSSIWFKLTPLLRGPDNPMSVLMRMGERYGGCLTINMGDQRVVLPPRRRAGGW